MTKNPSPTEKDEVAVSLADQRPSTWALGSLFERVVSANATGGTLGASIVTQPPGLATPLHVHTREAEAWFVLDGSLRYQAGAEVFDLRAGDFIYLPKDVPHALRITGTSPARCLALTLAGHLLDIYDEVGTQATAPQLPDGGIPAADIQRWMELAPQYGLRIVGPPIPETGQGG
jgi:quercetin dioxygenase-like cupin family protein